MQTIRIEAPAKINLVLDLLSKRSDGYHEVEFLMQELELRDGITCALRADGSIVLTCDDPSIYCDDRNLIVKAAKLLQRETGVQKGADIHLEKKIPMVGGLGGSSSNAVSTLKALNSLWEIELSDEDLLRLAISIGMDCAFFLFGKTCIARGRGELIERAPNPPRMNVLVVTPEVAVPENKTAWIYKNFSVERVKSHPSVSDAVVAIKGGDLNKIAATLGNVFEAGLAISEYKPVWELLAKLREEPLVRTAHLAGAGPAVFAIARDEDGGRHLQEEYCRHYKKILLTATVGDSVG